MKPVQSGMAARAGEIVLVFMLAACAQDQSSPIEWETVGKGMSYEPGCAERPDDDRLIRSNAEWNAYWNEVHPETPRPAVPSIDFARESVLATCGARPSPAYSSTITDVQPADADARSVHVVVTERQPGEGCRPVTDFVYEHHAVKINRVVQSATFGLHPELGPTCESPTEPLAMETLDMGSYSNCTEVRDWLIRTEQEWTAFWTQLHSSQSEPPARPTVDFERNSVVATCMGSQPSSGFSTRITDVSPAGADGWINVAIDEREPSACITLTVITGPYHVVKINRGQLSEANYEHTRQAYSCEGSTEPFVMETLDSGGYSACERGDWLIRTEQEWTEFWTQLHSNQSEPPERPAVDFERNSVVATCMGSQPSSGFSTHIATVSSPDVHGWINVAVEEEQGCGVLAVITDPYHVVKINRGGLAGADYKHSLQTHSCAAP